MSPTLGVGLLTVLASARSARCGVTTALAVLLAVLGSNWSAPVIVAVFVTEFGLATVPVKTRVCGTEVVTVPTFQRPVLIWYVPWLVAAETNDTPAGSRSVTWTLVASFGPLSVSVTV